jgi:hypothetical protein
MAIPNISTASQAVASYAAQLQAAQQKSSLQQTEPRAQSRSGGSRGGDQVTLSAESAQNADQTKVLRTNQNNKDEHAFNTQTVDRKQPNNPQEARSTESKSVTQALEDYVQASLV